ncbi:MAG TPA: SprT family zinc-dependent metalloprotease [Nevskiaceae bacterium]|nr:SprT family zinc-dependent metalloprotease [Nevskiaceae bacterium]
MSTSWSGSDRRRREPPLSTLLPWRLEERRSDRARQIRIEIRATDCVRLVIPRRASRSDAHRFLRERLGWIEDQLHELRREQQRSLVDTVERTRPLAWDDRDRLLFEGQPTALRCLYNPSPRVRVVFHPAAEGPAWFCLWCPPGTAEAARERALLQTLRECARDRARFWLEQEAPRLGVRYLGPRLGDQRSLWGSCAPSGLISLSWRLVLAPPAVLRYVVVHELCHRRHADHSTRFWDLVARQLPDYQEARQWLHEHGGLLHREPRHHPPGGG